MARTSKFYPQVRRLYLDSVEQGRITGAQPWGGYKIWRAILAQGETVTARNIFYLLARVKREIQQELQEKEVAE